MIDGIKYSNDPTDFVVLSEAVPDVILEIRYYSTYNFVGDRINGYEEPTALITKEAAAALQEVSEEWWHFTLKNEPYLDTYFTFPVNSNVIPER